MRPKSRGPLTALFFIFTLAVTILGAVGDGQWRSKVPDEARLRANPWDEDRAAVAAGSKLFQQHCSSCHGKSAEGRFARPNLHSDHIKNATPGELEWLLKNGSLKNGMPSWSRLPEQQRWQLVSFLKSL